MFICEKCGNKPLNNAAIEGALYRADMINKKHGRGYSLVRGN